MKIKIYTPETQELQRLSKTNDQPHWHNVYLGGVTSSNWQADFITKVEKTFPLDRYYDNTELWFLNPQHHNNNNLEAQLQWEEQAMDTSMTRVFWFPKEFQNDTDVTSLLQMVYSVSLEDEYTIVGVHPENPYRLHIQRALPRGASNHSWNLVESVDALVKDFMSILRIHFSYQEKKTKCTCECSHNDD